MYVCICNGYRDRDLRNVAETGVRNARQAFASLGAAPRCGRCLEMAQDLIDQHHRADGSNPHDRAA